MNAAEVFEWSVPVSLVVNRSEWKMETIITDFLKRAVEGNAVSEQRENGINEGSRLA